MTIQSVAVRGMRSSVSGIGGCEDINGSYREWRMAWRIRASMAAFGFVQDDGEAPPTEGESLLDVPAHSHVRAGLGDSIVPGHHPHPASAVIHLERAAPQCSEGIGDTPSNADLFARIATGILIQLGDVDTRRAAGKKHAADHDQKCGDDAGAK